MNTKELQLRPLSSLSKVFPHQIYGKTHRQVNAAQGQEVAFQVAFRVNADGYRRKIYQVQVKSPIQQLIRLYTVGTVPSTLAAYPKGRSDDNYLTLRAGVFPDPLFPVEDGCVTASVEIWHSLWVSVKLDGTVAAGNYPVRIVFRNPENGAQQSVTYTVTVHPHTLPKQELLFTQWFHCDCIADAHRVPVLSEAHWDLIGRYMRLAAEHGMNMILTPVVTPPLDTAVGAERPTVQLVEVTKNGNGYTFDFSRLARFVKLALSCGIHEFEIRFVIHRTRQVKQILIREILFAACEED